MRNFQRTIKNNGTISGTGLHTGKKATIHFLPAQINHGIKFQRTDLKNLPIINANLKRHYRNSCISIPKEIYVYIYIIDLTDLL